MKKNFLIFCLLLLMLNYVMASVDPNTAQTVARNFAIEKGALDKEQLQISLQSVQYDNENNPIIYIFAVNNSGFVMVSASEIANPILGYSFENQYAENPSTNEWFDNFKSQILKHQMIKTQPTEKVQLRWKHFTNPNFTPNASKDPDIAPLITTLWNQNKYYNTYCPWDANSGSYYDFRVPNGCVALAASMIMNYYRHPEVGVGGVSYVPTPYPRQTVLYSQHHYYWDAMGDELNGYSNEVAKLVYHVGVSCQMGYSADGSGSYNELVAQKMTEHFGYSTGYMVTYAGEYTGGYESDFIEILQTELNGLRPILYSGNDGNSGHAFLIDGYEDDYFHFNWGWGGSSNGYFLYDQITFNQGAVAICNIHPSSNYPANCTSFKRQTASTGYITDGSTNFPYQANPDCQWMIACPGASNYTFSFDRMSTTPDVDFVTIYNGPSTEDGIAAQYSGTTLPEGVVVSADSVLITFTSTGTTAKNDLYQGFLMTYSTNAQIADCSGSESVSSVFGRITDGSQDGENYVPRAVCNWLICPQYMSGFTFTFPKFDIKLGDMIDLYDATTTPATLWKRFDIYNLPTDGVINNFPFSKMKVTFISDNFVQGDGFAMDYYGIVGIDDLSGLSDVSVAPNPASDFVTVRFSSEKAQNVLCNIVDVTGKEIYSQSFQNEEGTSSQQINVSSIASGIYILNLYTNSGKVTHKILIQH